MVKRLAHLSVLFFAVLAWSLPTRLFAQETTAPTFTEGIISHDSDITVNADSTLQVRESITVLAAGRLIKRGISRDLTTHYNDRFGNPYDIHFDGVSVDRDDKPAEFRLRKLSNGLRIEMGGSEPIAPGEHTYELTYEVNRGLGFFSDYDELFWNVTGNAGQLPIQVATATVHLPKGIAQEAILLDGYTGRLGSAETDFTASADRQGNATFRTTRQLGPLEGLTLVVRWPKGFVHPPTDAQKHQYFLDDNQSTINGLLGLALLLGSCGLIWFLAERTLGTGRIMPQSEPPGGLSPATLRYIWRNAFDQKTLVVNLVDLAVKRQLAILEAVNGSYILGKVPPSAQSAAPDSVDDEEISADEALVLRKLLASGEAIPLKPSNHAVIGGAVEALHQHLRFKLERIHLIANSRYLLPCLLISLATVIRSGLAIQGVQAVELITTATAVMLWGFACLVLAGCTIGTWQSALSDPQHASTARKQAIVITAICAAAFAGEVAGLWVLAWVASTGVTAFLLLLVAINFGLHLYLKHSDLSGRGLTDRIEGFRLYLTNGEEGQNARASRRNSTAELESLLPYALALNVEKVWGEKFAAALALTARGGEIKYNPAWYSGPHWNPLTAATFLTTLGSSFSSEVSRSSSPLKSSPASSAASPKGRGDAKA